MPGERSGALGSGESVRWARFLGVVENRHPAVNCAVIESNPLIIGDCPGNHGRIAIILAIACICSTFARG